ncbi:VOC family protein [Paenibacillus macerans]|uniref:3-demethylubiquinone-9 3-methyltransferase family protein n=1 Tax=Paenibacillus macerans TaxID=44252 RepID=A0A090ZG42_PAEMA|nr:VOC family protein [Paenibacillus macerans]KFN09195.1 3-demethylubiquinone-9 3-methyltransferase family protein [Paenibacillus macerans]MBS5913016.1 VOC family protein [Paenibacillus macerans]MCY7560790.1 VOC family protein [Paenibacillus macerans]MEC0139969.1 VOC family protein [Paenibacillus macerans]MEC0151844.1 VOC family protein [Paenibacillus macerans]
MTMRLTPYLVMDGNAKEAISFYEKALEAKVIMLQSFGEMPENPEFPLPEAAKDRVSHALLKVGESEMMFSDTFPGQPHQSGTQVTICLTTNDAELAKRMFEALAEGGQINMPLQETFFSPAYGSLTDKFGVTFQIFVEGKI